MENPQFAQKKSGNLVFWGPFLTSVGPRGARSAFETTRNNHTIGATREPQRGFQTPIRKLADLGLGSNRTAVSCTHWIRRELFAMFGKCTAIVIRSSQHMSKDFRRPRSTHNNPEECSLKWGRDRGIMAGSFRDAEC